jgi:hypothetical protein
MSIDCPFCGASVELDELNENDGVCAYCDHRLLPVDFDYDSADDETVAAELITDEDEAIDDEGYYDDEDLGDDESLDDEEEDDRYSGIDDEEEDVDDDEEEDRFLRL